jgi:hypothetical protein
MRVTDILVKRLKSECIFYMQSFAAICWIIKLERDLPIDKVSGVKFYKACALESACSNCSCRVYRHSVVTDKTREMWSRNNPDTDNRNYVEDCNLLGCDAALLDESLLTFRMNITSSSSRIYWSILDRLPNPWIRKHVTSKRRKPRTQRRTLPPIRQRSSITPLL